MAMKKAKMGAIALFYDSAISLRSPQPAPAITDADRISVVWEGKYDECGDHLQRFDRAIRSSITIYYFPGKTTCVFLSNQDKLSKMRGDTRNLSGYLPKSGRYTECFWVSAQIRVLCGKCRGIRPNRDDIQNVSVQ